MGATVLTASATISGYVAQAVLFAMTPSSLSILGAVLMIAGVAALAAVKADRNAEDQGGSPVFADLPCGVDASVRSERTLTTCSGRLTTRAGLAPQVLGCLPSSVC